MDRGRVLLRAAQLLRDRQDDLSRTLTLEMGKTLAEARGEVGKAADFFEYYGGLGRAERGSLLSHENPDVMSWTVHEPLGVVLVITPWNDPLLTPARKVAPALISGNSVVLKPASVHPRHRDRTGASAGRRRPAVRRAEHGHRRGQQDRGCSRRPPGAEGRQLHGSNEVGDSLKASLADRNVRLLAELGGKNAAVVLADADLEPAIASIAAAAFAQAGQRCTATSRVLVQREVMGQVRDGLVQAARDHVLGPGLEPGDLHGSTGVAGPARLGRGIHRARDRQRSQREPRQGRRPPATSTAASSRRRS